MEENKGFFSRHKVAFEILGGGLFISSIFLARATIKLIKIPIVKKIEPCRYYYQEYQIPSPMLHNQQKMFTESIKNGPIYNQIKEHFKSTTEFNWANFIYDPLWEMENRVCIGFTLSKELMKNKELQYNLGKSNNLKHKDLPATTVHSILLPKNCGLFTKVGLVSGLYMNIYYNDQEKFDSLINDMAFMELMTSDGYEIRVIIEKEDSFRLNTFPEKKTHKGLFKKLMPAFEYLNRKKPKK